jgi:hypothetical protein
MKSNKCWQELEIGTVVHCRLKCEMVKPLWKTVWQFFKELNVEFLYDSAILLPGIYSKAKLKTGIWNRYLYTNGL